MPKECSCPIGQNSKREGIALARQPAVSCRQIPLKVGDNPNLLSGWRREADEERGKAFKGSNFPREQEVAHLKLELARVKKESDFLLEAAVFFAKESS